MTTTFPAIIHKARELGGNSADAYWDEFGTSPADDGERGVGDWDSSAWSIHWHDLKGEGATDADYEACLEAWRAGFWGDGPTTRNDASDRFLAAWEAAGKPPVKKLVYPRYGQGRDKVLSSESDIRMFAKLDPEVYPEARFHDNGEDVKLSWTYGNPSVEHSDSGSTELYFDRANPIRRNH